MSKKSNKPVTHVAIVLDKSGSMAHTKDQAIQGYNEHIQQFKENSKDQDIRVSLVTFNGNIYEHLWEEDASKLTEASAEDYVPNGSTALFTAVGYTIQKLMDTTDTEDENAAYLLIVISDGQNTDHGVYTAAAVREMTQAVEKTGRWTISYLGCSKEYLNELSRQTGVSASNMAAWDNSTARNTQIGMKLSAEKADKYLKCRSAGITASNTYMNDQLGAVADFTSVVEGSNHTKDSPEAGGVVPVSTSGGAAVMPENWQIKLNGLYQTPSAGISTLGMNHTVTTQTANAAPAILPEATPSRSVSELRNTMKYKVGDTKITGKTVFGKAKPVKFNV